ncbi:MAG: hydroxyacylglutathione hydrolase [Rhizomicrobium sp.]
MPFRIECLCVFETNYAYLICDTASGRCAAIDPADAETVAAAITRKGLTLDFIFNTHHHNDHCGGNLALKKQFNATVCGPARDAGRIPGMDVALRGGEGVDLFDHTIGVIETPGHTSGSICYLFGGALFTGDTLFAMGCGRLFEGDAATMLASFHRIASLPDNTQIYPGHEYTLADARFAAPLEPGNTALQARLQAAVDGKVGPGFTLRAEKDTNPFMRTDSPALRATLGMDEAPNEAVFAELRSRKDLF